MARVRLFFTEMSQIKGSDGLSAVVLTDKAQQRALTVVIDRTSTEQINLRMNYVPECEMLLPEVLLGMIEPDIREQLELIIYDVFDGQYQVSLLHRHTDTVQAIRMSDALLLNMLASVPLYIEQDLMSRQSSPYKDNSQGVHVPINALDIERLNVELERAIANEDYRLASHLQRELDTRRTREV